MRKWKSPICRENHRGLQNPKYALLLFWRVFAATVKVESYFPRHHAITIMGYSLIKVFQFEKSNNVSPSSYLYFPISENPNLPNRLMEGWLLGRVIAISFFNCNFSEANRKTAPAASRANP